MTLSQRRREFGAGRVVITVGDGIADVQLTRGAKHNALDRDMVFALRDAIATLAGASDVRAIVLSGAGPSFCSGLDLGTYFSPEADAGEVFARRDGDPANVAQGIAYGWQRLAVPVIAAIHGVCYGGGLQIALGADIRLAAPDARLSVMELKWGLIPDMAITQTLPRLVGADVAKELVLTARVLSGEDALGLRLVTRVSDNPYRDAHELARHVAGRSPDAVRAAKRLLNEGWLQPASESLLLEETLSRSLIGTPNQLEAVRAGLAGVGARFEDPLP